MEDDKKIEAAAEAVGQKTRRSFVKTAAQVAVTAPAVAMLLTASTKKAAAQVAYKVADDVAHSFDDSGSSPADFGSSDLSAGGTLADDVTIP